MADEETTAPAPDTAGSPPQTPPPATNPKPPETAPKDSPFLGKLVTHTTPVRLDGAGQQVAPAPQVPETIVAQSAAPIPTSPPPSPNQKLDSEDVLHTGNVISLLEQEAQKRGEMPVPAPLTQPETPTERSIREIGMKPRPEKIRDYAQEEKKRQQEEREREQGLPRIRTYASDMSEEIRKRGETLATIISAERDKMGRGPIGNEVAEKKEEPSSPRNTALMIGAGALVVVGLVALVLAFIFIRPAKTEVAHISLVPANHVQLLPDDGRTALYSSLTAEKLAADLQLGEIKEIVVTEAGVALPASRILEELGAPNILARNATSIMVGIHAFDRNQPFILVTVSEYNLAFEGMLAWEPKIAADLGAFFAPSRLVDDQIYATPPLMEFSDRVVENIDVRESENQWRILYAFPRRDLLLITTNEHTLKEILTRLSLQSRN